MIIHIKKLKVCAIFGLYSHERCKSRDLFISAKITVTNIKAIKTDKIEDTVDYDAIAEVIRKETKKTKYYTLEKLAAHLCSEIKKIDKRIKSIKIRIDKPGAIKDAENVSVVYEA